MTNYSKAQRILHKIVLENKFLVQSLYEIEKILFLKKTKNFKNNNHLFISGLPRSGTTFLLNYFYKTRQYGSLTYKDMPFVMAPNFFSKLKKKINLKKKERMHKDGIEYNVNSPEALDEVFISKININELNNYINLILLNKKKTKYLSKNNLNYKRINNLVSIFPNAKILIPIRNPVDHAKSLLTQHINFISNQKKNNFVRSYMKYLNHHEFGIDHISWYKPINFKDYNDINYWLEQWYLFYKNIYKRRMNDKNCFFVNFDNLDNKRYLKKILLFTNCETNKRLIYFRKKKNTYHCNLRLKIKCMNLFKKII